MQLQLISSALSLSLLGYERRFLEMNRVLG